VGAQRTGRPCPADRAARRRNQGVASQAARPLAHANQMANAFIAGARISNPKITVKVSFNGSYFDKSLAEDAALVQIESGVDVIYALCLGVMEAVGDKQVKVINNLGGKIKDKSGPVLASVVWDVAPTIDYLIDQVANGTFSSSDIRSFSLATDRGATLTRLDAKFISPELAKKVDDQLQAIQSGGLKFEFSDQQPAKLSSP
jgi:basic membrane lipoprotein Med (substrate-binding protein (PBP1-ABC) superfamily)